MKNTLIVLTSLIVFCVGCRNDGSTVSENPEATAVSPATGLVVADTIIYDVTIINENPEDAWTEQRLKRLDRTSLVDTIFYMIYSGKVTAYDHTTGEKLTPRQVEKIENEDEFSRSDIGMIQFKEAWYLDPDKAKMTKEVISMVLGIGVYGNNGEFRGNKALFRIELNKR